MDTNSVKTYGRIRRKLDKDENELIEKLFSEIERLTALLQRIHDDATTAPGGYLVSGGIMREIAEVVK